MMKKNINQNYTTNNIYTDFFNLCGVKEFESISDEKIEILKKEAEKIKKLYEKTDKVFYYQSIILYIRKNVNNFDRKEKALLTILCVDPECLTWKIYQNTKITDINSYKDAYMSAINTKDKKIKKKEYEEAMRKRASEIYDLSKKIESEVGIYLPSLIPIEKLYLKRNKYLTLKLFTDKDYLSILDIVLRRIDLVKEVTEEEKINLDLTLKQYQHAFPKTDVNLLVYHVFKQPTVLGLKNLSEQLYFLINAASFGYEQDETLAAIYEYFCNWSDMNDELIRVYGCSSEALLRLQSHYNSIYKIKGNF